MRLEEMQWKKCSGRNAVEEMQWKKCSEGKE